MNDIKAIPTEINWDASLPVYASENFLRSESNEFGWLGGTDNGIDIECVLPYTILRKSGFAMVRFRTATIPLTASLSSEAETAFLNNVVEYFRSAGTDLILPSPNTAVFQVYPDGAFAAPYGTVIKDLRQPESTLWSEIRKTYRQNIRKAELEGVKVVRGMEFLDAAYELIAATMKRSGASFKTHGDFCRRILSLGKNVELFVAQFDGAIQGCMVAPYSLNTAYNCYAGSLPVPALGAMHLLHWEAIRYFRAHGVRFFDFQGIRIDPDKGSKQDGIANYKRGFGGSVIQGYTWKYPLRPLKSAAYSLAVRLLMGGDTVDQERHKLRPSASAS